MRTKEERNKLVMDNWALVYHIYIHIRKKRTLIFRMNNYDALQAGRLGLIRAAEKFDPARGSFSSLAGACIRNEIILESYRNCLVRPAWYDWVSKRNPQKYIFQRQLATNPIVPFEKEWDIISDNDGIDQEEDEDRKWLVFKMLLWLPERMSNIIWLRYWEDKTLEEIGSLMGLSKQRVGQIEKEAFSILRKKYHAMTVERG